MSDTVRSIAILTGRQGKAEALKALLVAMAPQSRAEPGNLRWDLWCDRSEPARYILDERYRDEAAVAAHHETPHYRDYASKVTDLAERTVLMLEPVDVCQDGQG